MDKEKILQMARDENNGIDEVALSVSAHASKFSKSFGLFLCLLLNLLSSIFFDVHKTAVISSVCMMIYCSMVASDYWVRAVCLKLRIHYIAAIVCTVAACLCAIILFIHC